MNVGHGEIRERHNAKGDVEIWSEGEIDITEPEPYWSAKSGTFTWRPTRLTLDWAWFDAVGWQCTGAVLFGYRLRKDGSVGQRDHSIRLIDYRGKWVTDPPSYVTEAEERMRPMSRVVTDA